MSAGYAERLTKGYDYGQCGLPEREDSARRRELLVGKLVDLVRRSNYIVAHTGAGISTSCGIPDFRGPRGVWTMEKKGLPRVDATLDKPWEEVLPSKTHLALLGLQRVGKLKFIVTQNVDGLHLRSGFERDKVAELHGNVFKEVCEKCNAEFFRPFDVCGMGFKPTGRNCTVEKCEGPLKDELLDWEDALPEGDLEISTAHCKRADLSLCLGTSLRVMPANGLPMLTKENDVKLSGYVDEVMVEVMQRLNIPIPTYEAATDFVAQKRHLIFPTRFLVAPEPARKSVKSENRKSVKQEAPLPSNKKAVKRKAAEVTLEEKEDESGEVNNRMSEARPKKKIKKEQPS